MLRRGNEGYEVVENEVKEVRKERLRRWEEIENVPPGMAFPRTS